ncbi:MAG: DNA-directed RNA polymerase subunit K [archaeon]
MSELTRFEKTRLISARSFQLALGAPPMVKADKDESMIDVARKELEEKKIPLAVVRLFPSGEKVRVEP